MKSLENEVRKLAFELSKIEMYLKSPGCTLLLPEAVDPLVAEKLYNDGQKHTYNYLRLLNADERKFKNGNQVSAAVREMKKQADKQAQEELKAVLDILKSHSLFSGGIKASKSDLVRLVQAGGDAAQAEPSATAAFLLQLTKNKESFPDIESLM